MPDEDKWLTRTPISKRCDHEYIDLYSGWARSEEDSHILKVWVLCKKCLDKKLLSFDMSWEETQD